MPEKFRKGRRELKKQQQIKKAAKRNSAGHTAVVNTKHPTLTEQIREVLVANSHLTLINRQHPPELKRGDVVLYVDVIEARKDVIERRSPKVYKIGDWLFRAPKNVHKHGDSPHKVEMALRQLIDAANGSRSNPCKCWSLGFRTVEIDC